jgi:hypothetical protein
VKYVKNIAQMPIGVGERDQERQIASLSHGLACVQHVDMRAPTSAPLINNEFGKEAPITNTRGRIHDYLGMTLDYPEKGKVTIKMLDYLEKMLADLPDKMDDEAPSPAVKHMFAVNDNQTKVDEEKAQFFHTYVAKTLFLCKRARPDLQTAVAFLCTRHVTRMTTRSSSECCSSCGLPRMTFSHCQQIAYTTCDGGAMLHTLYIST